jgi:hypothetical protein
MDEAPTAYETFKNLAENASGPISRRLTNTLIAAVADGESQINVGAAIVALTDAIISLDTVVAAATNYEMR